MKQPQKLLSTTLSTHLFQKSLDISLDDISPIKYLELTDGKNFSKEIPYFTKKEAMSKVTQARAEYLRRYNQPWEDNTKIKENKNTRERQTPIKVKIFKVWELALIIYFDFLLRDEFKNYRMQTASIFNRQMQRKWGCIKRSSIIKDYERWLFNLHNPCRNKTGRPTPLIVNWTIVWLREIELQYSKIAEILNSLAPWGINCTDRKLILRYKRLDVQLYKNEFPISASAEDTYFKFFNYYTPPSRG